MRPTLRGHDHVNGPATLEVTAVDQAQTGLQELLNSSQLTIKTGHMESWLSLQDNEHTVSLQST